MERFFRQEICQENRPMPPNRDSRKMKDKKQNLWDDSRCLAAVRTALLVLAVILIIHGILNGSMKDVFQKAVRICMECIGLG